MKFVILISKAPCFSRNAMMSRNFSACNVSTLSPPLSYQHFFEAASMVPFCAVPAAAAHDHVAKPEWSAAASATVAAVERVYSGLDVAGPHVNFAPVRHRFQASVLSSGVIV